MRYLISIFFGLLLALGSPTVSQAAVISGGQEFGPTDVSANNTDFFTLDTAKYRSVIVQVTSVGGGGTISWQGSNDPTFATTVALRAIPSVGGQYATSTSTTGHWVIHPTTRYLRVRTTAYTSGTLTVRATATEKEVVPQNLIALARTYSATHRLTVAASATDIAILPGNATTTVQVTRVKISGIQTTTGTVDVLLIGRGTANSGGTSTNFSVLKHDQADVANSSTPIGYTANPTPGTAAGTVYRRLVPVGSAASGLSEELVLDLAASKPLTLVGASQGLAVNLNGVTVTGGSFVITFEWIEY